MGVFMAIPGLVIFLGACGTVLGSTAGLSSQRNAAVFGAVFMGLPFFSLLVLALFHACKLRAGHLAAEALSASAMGATLSVLSVRFVNWIEALRATVDAPDRRRLQFTLASLVLLLTFSSALLAFLELACEGVG